MSSIDLVTLHPEAKEISFRHKFVILHTFKKKILGILGLDYIALLIVDKNQVLSIYSSCPALEFNLIYNSLWMHDGIFEVKNHTADSFMYWDELYNNDSKKRLIAEKEVKFGFKFGFYVMKSIDDLFVIYSFATKQQNAL